jgi:hypothetical protein
MPASRVKSTWPRWLATAVLMAIAVFASGCLKADINLTLAKDGTADGTVVLALSKAYMTTNGMTEADAEQSMRDQLEDEGGPAFECDHWEDGTYLGVECTVEGATLEELSAEDVMGYQLTFENVDDTIDLSGDVNLQSLDPATAGFEDFESTLAVEFPGLVQEQTDGEQDERTVTWEFELGRRTQVLATAAIGGGIPWLLLGGGLAILLVVGAVVAFVLIRRRTPATPTQPTQPSPPPGG